MTKKKFILVGASVSEKDSRGGVGTLSNALVDYANRAGLEIVIIDTSKKPFVKKNFFQDVKSGVLRVINMTVLLYHEKYSGVIIFSSAGWGFYEKIMLSFICRMARVTSVLFIVDGWFFSVRNKSFLTRWWIGFLLKIPNILAASGLNWIRLFIALGVKESHLAIVHYWLPKSFKIQMQPKVLHAGEPIKFVFVGWMIKEKGLNEILTAVGSLYHKHLFNFTFIGDGPMLESVREIIKNSKWESRIFARGWLSNEQKKQELATAHVFVLPSHAEGFPMSLIEAMLSGLPAICSDVGGISDSLHDGVNGFLIPRKNSQSLKEAMQFYIENPDTLLKHSIEASKIGIQNHSSDKNCKALFSALTKGKLT